MNTTHNRINQAIAEMERITAKGQPFAKINKDREIRSVLRDMRTEQRRSPTIKDVLFYFRLWLATKIEENMIKYYG